jgi:DNA (cytosine-5)-methyltransferase 1
MSKKTFGSLFAGVGGFDIGMERAGWECSWQVEWDKHCQSVLQRHWADVPKYWDIKDVKGAELNPVDCIIFGSPCQDLSIAGKGTGLEGSRSGLFHEGIRIIKEMRDATKNEFPKWSIWENVPGALTSNQGNDFARVLDEMANIGALGLEWHVLDAQWFGVAQRRRRVFLLACYDPATASRCPEQILPVPQDSKGDIKKSRKARKHASRTAEASLDQTVLYGESGHGRWSEGGVTLTSTDYKRPERNVVCEPATFVKVCRPGARDENGELPPEVWREQGVSPTLNTFENTEVRTPVVIAQNDSVLSFHMKQDPISSENISQTLYGQPGIGIAIPIQGTIINRSDKAGPQGKGFGSENDPSYTLDTISQHGVMTPELILRRLTPTECERLMGFPDDHTKYTAEGRVVADSNRYKMCGNAVASPVAEWIGKKIYEI